MNPKRRAFIQKGVPVIGLVLAIAAALCVKTCRMRSADPDPLVWYGMTSYPYFSEVREGVEAAESGIGIQVLKVVRPVWSKELKDVHVHGFAEGQHKGYIIFPGDPSEANVLFRELTQHKKFVVAYGAEPSLPTPASFTVATDIRRAATEACEELVQLMGGAGRILNVLESEADLKTKVRNQAIEAVAANYSEVTITQTLSGMTEVRAAKEKILNTLAARSQVIDGVIATGGHATQAAAAALSEWHANPEHRRIRFIGIDTDPVVMEAIEKGLIDATVAQNHFGQGYMSYLLLARMIEGWIPYRPYVFIDAGHVIVNRKNVATFQEELWRLADDRIADFEKMYLRPPP